MVYKITLLVNADGAEDADDIATVVKKACHGLIYECCRSDIKDEVEDMCKNRDISPEVIETAIKNLSDLLNHR